MSLAEYDPDDPKGWVLRGPARVVGDRTILGAWWFGPDSGFGTTYGSLHLDRERWPTTLEAAVFPTKAEALRAFRKVNGGSLRGHSVYRLADALEALGGPA